MADTKLSDLALRNALAGTDKVYVVAGGVSYSTTVDVLLAYARTNMYPQVATYADLPVSTGSGAINIVQTSTGIWPTRKYAGFWRDTGGGWVWLGNATWVAAEIGFTPTGGIAATDVAGALAELDTEKASIASLAAIATSGSGADLTASSVALGKLANLAANSIMGNNTGAGATPLALTSAQVKTLLAIAAGDVSGLATIATSGSGSDVTPNVQGVVSASTVTPTFANNQVNITAQAAALALANWTGSAIPAWKIVIRIKDDGTARAISYDTKYRAIGITLPTTTVISKTLYLGIIYNSADDKFDVVAVSQEA